MATLFLPLKVFYKEGNRKVIKLFVNRISITIHLIFVGFGSCVLSVCCCFYTAHLFCYVEKMVKATTHSKKKMRERKKLKITTHKSQKSNFFARWFRWLMNDVLVEFLWYFCAPFFGIFLHLLWLFFLVTGFAESWTISLWEKGIFFRVEQKRICSDGDQNLIPQAFLWEKCFPCKRLNKSRS